jgi:hypothetical protein
MADGERKSYRLVLDFCPEPWSLSVSGEVENLDMALSILQGALRDTETKYRIAAGIAAQQELKQHVDENARVREQILGKVRGIRQ